MFLNNTWSRPPDRFIIATSNRKLFLAHLCDQVSRGSKTLFFSSSTSVGEAVHTWALGQGKASYFFRGSLDEQEKTDFLDNINEDVPQFDLLVSTNAMETGVDIRVQHFDIIFMYCMPHLAASTYAQMAQRIRNLSGGPVVLCFPPGAQFRAATNAATVRNVVCPLVAG